MIRAGCRLLGELPEAGGGIVVSGLARSRSEAASLVSEGQVLVNGRTARKAGLRAALTDGWVRLTRDT